MYGRQRELGKDRLFGLDIPWEVSVWKTEGGGERPVVWVGHSMGGECMEDRGSWGKTSCLGWTFHGR